MKNGNQITGRDLHQFTLKHQLLAMAQAASIFGMAGNTLKNLLNKPDTPIADPSICMLFRFYSDHPDALKKVSILDFYTRLKESGLEIPATEFSFILGRERTAYLRWFQSGASSPVLEILINEALRKCKGDAVAAYELIRKLSREEQDARELSDEAVNSMLWNEDRVKLKN